MYSGQDPHSVTYRARPEANGARWAMRAVIATTDTRRGGTPKRTASIALGMIQRGWEILYVSVMPGGEVLDELKTAGVTTASLHISGFSHLPRGALRFRKLVTDWKPDVVQSALWHANVLARFALVGSSIPLVDGFENVDSNKSRVRVLLDRWTRSRSIATIAVSNAVKSSVIARESISLEKVRVIPFGLEISQAPDPRLRRSLREEWGVPEDVRAIGWVGRIEPVKDLHTLIEAVAKVPGLWLIVAGWGSEESQLENWAEEANISDRFRKLGPIEDSTAFLNSVDGFCLTSLWEGMPLALLEAMAAGLPVVATPVGGVTEMIEDGRNGFLAPPQDPAAVAGSIATALENPSVGAAARNTIETRFSREAMLDAYEEVWLSATRS